ncbi:MAG: hemerythrin domain-containing protein [bacterium]|nr:hemerythrin domain-containing protein [bacterium]
MQTRMYRNQHTEITRLGNELLKLCVTSQPKEIRLKLAKLAGSVKIHLAIEDQALYPKMMAHPDAKIRNLATRYQDEMGELAKMFTAMYARWSPLGNIEHDRAGFGRDFGTVWSALVERMEKEDGDLYDIVDRKVELAPIRTAAS